MLYILTPPYNTGNDFVYNDDFKQSKYEFDLENNLIDEDGNKVQTRNTKSDGKFHTNWLNMMYPRLLLARKLLKEDGVIFISIDDNEQARLKMLCDEVFGEENFVADIIWKARRGGGNDVKNVAIDHEYVLVYAKNKIDCLLVGALKGEENFKYKDEYYEQRGKYNLQQFDRASLTYTKSLDYSIEAPDGSKIYPGHVSQEEWEKRKENATPRNDWRWMMSEQTFIDAKEKGFIVFEQNNKTKIWNVKVKTYQKASYKNNDIEIERFLKLRSVLDDKFGTTRHGNIEIENLKLKHYFSYPKPTLLIKEILKYFNNKNITVLDFFAGSGTTGQAVMELNKEDGGNRKYILVQFPEKSENLENTEFETIADITRERIKRSIQMYDYKEKGFKAFKLSDSNFKSFDATTDESIEEIQKKLMQNIENIKEDVSIQDLIYEIILRDTSLTLDSKLESKVINNNKVVYNDTKDYLFLLEPTINNNYYDYELLIKTIKDVCEKEQSVNIFIRDKYFKNDQDKINFAEAIKDIDDLKDLIITTYI